jgi:hypothetical protein
VPISRCSSTRSQGRVRKARGLWTRSARSGCSDIGGEDEAWFLEDYADGGVPCAWSPNPRLPGARAMVIRLIAATLACGLSSAT